MADEVIKIGKQKFYPGDPLYEKMAVMAGLREIPAAQSPAPLPTLPPHTSRADDVNKFIKDARDALAEVIRGLRKTSDLTRAEIKEVIDEAKREIVAAAAEEFSDFDPQQLQQTTKAVGPKWTHPNVSPDAVSNDPINAGVPASPQAPISSTTSSIPAELNSLVEQLKDEHTTNEEMNEFLKLIAENTDPKKIDKKTGKPVTIEQIKDLLKSAKHSQLKSREKKKAVDAALAQARDPGALASREKDNKHAQLKERQRQKERDDELLMDKHPILGRAAIGLREYAKVSPTAIMAKGLWKTGAALLGQRGRGAVADARDAVLNKVSNTKNQIVNSSVGQQVINHLTGPSIRTATTNQDLSTVVTNMAHEESPSTTPKPASGDEWTDEFNKIAARDQAEIERMETGGTLGETRNLLTAANDENFSMPAAVSANAQADSLYIDRSVDHSTTNAPVVEIAPSSIDAIRETIIAQETRQEAHDEKLAADAADAMRESQIEGSRTGQANSNVIESHAQENGKGKEKGKEEGGGFMDTVKDIAGNVIGNKFGKIAGKILGKGAGIIRGAGSLLSKGAGAVLRGGGSLIARGAMMVPGLVSGAGSAIAGLAGTAGSALAGTGSAIAGGLSAAAPAAAALGGAALVAGAGYAGYKVGDWARNTGVGDALGLSDKAAAEDRGVGGKVFSMIHGDDKMTGEGLDDKTKNKLEAAKEKLAKGEEITKNEKVMLDMQDIDTSKAKIKAPAAKIEPTPKDETKMAQMDKAVDAGTASSQKIAEKKEDQKSAQMAATIAAATQAGGSSKTVINNVGKGQDSKNTNLDLPSRNNDSSFQRFIDSRMVFLS